MASRFIDKVATATTSNTRNLPDAAGIAYETSTGNVVINAAGSLIPLAQSAQAPVVATSTLAVTQATHAGKTIALSAVAGFTSTLPAATGSGAKYRFVVITALTSAAYIISVTGDDIFYGGVLVNDTGDSTPLTVDFYPTAANSNTYTMAFSAQQGQIGDWVEFEDIAADKWAVRGHIQGGLDPVTPFSNV